MKNTGKVREICQSEKVGTMKLESIFQSGKSQGLLLRLEKSGNFTKILDKSEKNCNGKLKEILEICQLVTVKTLQIWTLKKLLKYWKTAKNTGKVGKFVSLKKWES